MDHLDEEPLSLPCSAPEAKIGLPTLVQLYLVDDGLKKNPLPREDFYRQYSITPERQTPEEERTPPPPVYSPRTSLQISKDWALKVANSLKRFHAGRVMLKREQAEQHEDLEQDPDYWDAKSYQYQLFGTELFEEMGERRMKELNGEAEEGYAQAMLLSPLPSSSSPPKGPDISETTQQLKPLSAIEVGSPDLNRCPPQPDAGRPQEPLQSTPEHVHDSLPPQSTCQKRKCIKIEDEEKKDLEHVGRTKRQRRGMPTVQQKQNPVSTTKSAQRLERAAPNVPIIKTHEEGSLPKPPILPWKLRSRKPISYRETGLRKAIADGGRRGKGEKCQPTSRRDTKQLHGGTL